MDALGTVIGLIVFWFGIIFCVIGTIGMMRLPDVYTRIYASTKVATLGLFGLLIGAAFLLPEVAPKAVVLIVFMTITSPVASHAIAEAAYRSGVPMRSRSGEPVRDDLARKRSTRRA